MAYGSSTEASAGKRYRKIRANHVLVVGRREGRLRLTGSSEDRYRNSLYPSISQTGAKTTTLLHLSFRATYIHLTELAPARPSVLIQRSTLLPNGGLGGSKSIRYRSKGNLPQYYSARGGFGGRIALRRLACSKGPSAREAGPPLVQRTLMIP